MGQAAHELPVHPRPDDRHLGQRHDGRHHHRQSRHDGREVSRPAVRGRHGQRDDGDRRQARIASRAPMRASSTSSTAPTSRTARSWPNAAARPSCASAQRRRRDALAALRAGRQPAEAREGPDAPAPMSLLIDLEDSVALAAKDRGPARHGRVSRRACATTAERPRLLRARQRPDHRPDRRGSRWRSCAQAPTASCCRRRSAARTCRISAPSSPCARRNSACADGATRILAIATENAAGVFALGTFAGASHRLMGLDLGRRGSLGRSRRRDEPRRRRRLHGPLPPRPRPSRSSARPQPASTPSIPSTPTSAT